MGKPMLFELKKNMLRYVNSISLDDNSFIDTFKMVFTIQNICDIMRINRNRYNYLVRNNLLDKEILKYREKPHDISEGCDEE